MEIVGQILAWCKALSEMDAKAVWIFFTVILLLREVWQTWQAKKERDEIVEIRIREVEADLLTARALDQLSKEVRDTRDLLIYGGSNVRLANPKESTSQLPSKESGHSA